MMLRESILSSDRLFFISGLFQVWICHLHRQFYKKWYLEIVIAYIQKNRRQVNFCSKWSLIHTNDAPWKYFEFWPPVFYIWTFPGLDLSFAPPILPKWYLEIVITHVQKNRRQVHFCSKSSLIHTYDAPWKYFDFWPPVFNIWTFSGLDLSFAPPILAKVIFRNRHYSYTKKSQASKFLLKVVAYTYKWCSVKVFWVLTACFLYFDIFRFGFVICTADFGQSDISK